VAQIRRRSAIRLAAYAFHPVRSRRISGGWQGRHTVRVPRHGPTWVVDKVHARPITGSAHVISVGVAVIDEDAVQPKCGYPTGTEASVIRGFPSGRSVPTGLARSCNPSILGATNCGRSTRLRRNAAKGFWARAGGSLHSGWSNGTSNAHQARNRLCDQVVGWRHLVAPTRSASTTPTRGSTQESTSCFPASRRVSPIAGTSG